MKIFVLYMSNTSFIFIIIIYYFKQHAVPLFIEAGVLPLKFSFFKITANLIYNVRQKIAPSRIQKQFQDISNIHPHYTRSSASNNFCSILTRDLRDTSAMLNQLSCQAKHWERGQFVEFMPFHVVK